MASARTAAVERREGRPARIDERYCRVMAEERTWTAAELEQLTPDERHRVVNDGVVTNLADVSPEFLDRVRAKGRALLAERGVIPRPDGE